MLYPLAFTTDAILRLNAMDYFDTKLILISHLVRCLVTEQHMFISCGKSLLSFIAALDARNIYSALIAIETLSCFILRVNALETIFIFWLLASFSGTQIRV